MGAVIRVFLLDDHEIVRRGLRDLLEATVTGGRGWSRSASDEFAGDLDRQQTRWQHARDRVAALDGEIDVRGSDDSLQVTARIPLNDPAGPAGGRGG